MENHIMRISPMTLTYHPGGRRIGRTAQAAAPLYLIGLAGPESPARGLAVQALQALGFTVGSFAAELQRQVAEAWRTDVRDVVPGEAWELAAPALAAGRCVDPFFRAWSVRRGLELERARSPRWATMHWSLFRREADPWAFVRGAEAWLVAQHLQQRSSHLVLTDVHTLREYQLLQHWGGRTLELSVSRFESPLGPHDAWISAADTAHLAERVAINVAEMFGVQALGARSVQ
jgi:hypothetical protein